MSAEPRVRRAAVAVRVHDRTHLEMGLDYELGEARAGDEPVRYVWEAYFFAPESLRLDSRTYDKSDLYADLQSYVRFEVPDSAWEDLDGEPLDAVEAALARGEDAEAVRELRLFACRVRAAGVELRDAVREGLSAGGVERDAAISLSARLVEGAQRMTRRLRRLVDGATTRPDPLRTAAQWVDEDVSRLVETLAAELALDARARGAPLEVTERLEALAVGEARYRQQRGMPAGGRAGMGAREVEELEFRRHVLKRFTSSVLWLSPEVRPAATWVLHLFHALAAAIAMAFALAAALVSGTDPSQAGSFLGWALAVVVAYAMKDRIKALLQAKLSGVVARHFPDRRWTIRDRERGLELGTMDEQAGFVAFSALPPDVLATRRLTRAHPLEEQARPETVLYHRKQVELHPARVRAADARFAGLTEILRLDLRRWIVHTDDPKHEIAFADPDLGEVGTAIAPRVYNIALVYRLYREGEPAAAWRRARVVVSRKGIRRLEVIV
ncbi:MAG: hypothetical protein NZ898_04715 [Myxococcota bacterium]|nr:hypothetical protein [Myxococcota bacterium]